MTYTPISRGSSNWDAPVNAAFTDQDNRITTNTSDIGALQGTVSSHTTQIDTANTNITNLQTATATLDWQPQDMNMKAWTQDPAGCGSTGSASTSGVMYLSRVLLRNAATISNLYYTVATAGVTLTAGQNWCGLYNSTGTKLAEGPDQSTAMTSLGTKTVAITPQALAAGSYYIALLTNGATPPQFMRGNGASGSALNVGLTVSTGRFLDFGTGQTTLPASVNLASAAFNAAARWGAMN